jgi:rfaE bifunctional protein kinase chain/domain
MALSSVIRRFRRARVLVVGDVMLDEYIWGSVERISPEAPVPVVKMERRTCRLGGAGNVAANICSLGGECLAVGLIGDDAVGAELRRCFRDLGLTTQGLVRDAGLPTTHKVRIVAHHQQLLRLDAETTPPASGNSHRALTRRALRGLSRHGTVVLSDYGKGAITGELITAVIAGARRAGARVVVDPKLGHLPLYAGADVITPNHHEAGAACGFKITDMRSLLAAGERLFHLTGCNAVLITRGPEGMSLFQRGRRPVHIPTEAREVYDVSGAGDTVVATLALALAAGEDLERAARFANRAAGIVVGKLGVATLTPQELAASLRKQPLRVRR